MKTFSIEDIRSWNPRYDLVKHLPESWKGNVLDILNLKDVPFEGRLWVVCRQELLSDKLMRLFAVQCARQVQHLMRDERSVKALDIAEAFANEQATREELEAAWDAADFAAWEAAWDAARAAASDAARAAASDAAWDAANDAAWDAARGAASAAAWDVARAVTWEAAWDATSDAQKKKLIEMIKAGIETGDVK